MHGEEGTGKTTFGAMADNPIFIAAEGGCDQVTNSEGHPVDEMEMTASWQDLMKNVDQLITLEHDFKTLTIDSADWVEKLCHKAIIGSSGKSINTINGGYGAGIRKAESMHMKLIEKLSVLREKRNMNIIIIAHSHVKTAKDPSMPEDYDRFEIKCNEYVSALWREWVDAVFFVKFKTYIGDGETKTARAYGDDERIVYTVKRPAFQAKNRYGMPSEISPFTIDFWNQFCKFKTKGRQPETKQQLIDSINELSEKIEDEEIVNAVKLSVEKMGENLSGLKHIKDRVINLTMKEN